MSANERKSLFHFGYRRSPDQDAATPVRHGSSSSAPARSACHWRSISPSAACRRCCSTMPTGSARARAGFAIPSARWKSWIGFGVGEKLVDMGVTWKLGKVYLGDELVYSFDLLPEDGHKMPAFINLQQYLSGKGAGRSRAGSAADRSALAQPRHRDRAAQRRRDADDRNPGRSLSIWTPPG